MATSPEEAALAGFIVIIGVILFIIILVGRAWWLACGGVICW
jgi:hypothetical protein